MHCVDGHNGYWWQSGMHHPPHLHRKRQILNGSSVNCFLLVCLSLWVPRLCECRHCVLLVFLIPRERQSAWDIAVLNNFLGKRWNRFIEPWASLQRNLDLASLVIRWVLLGSSHSTWSPPDSEVGFGESSQPAPTEMTKDTVSWALSSACGRGGASGKRCWSEG